MSGPLNATRVHASSVAFEIEGEWTGILISGQSGRGKSELALQLIGLGARLVADDQTELRRVGEQIRLSAPAELRGLIELRHLGILHTEPVGDAVLRLVVDLDEIETERLPRRHMSSFLGLPVRRLRHTPSVVFAIGLKLVLQSGRWQDEE